MKIIRFYIISIILNLLIFGIPLICLIDLGIEKITYITIYIVLVFVIFFIWTIILADYISYFPRPESGKYNTNFNIYSAIIKDSKCNYINFKYVNGFFICESKNTSKVKLNLRGLIFKKTFIKSYVIRNLRYEIISSKLNFNKLFNKKIKIPTLNNLTLRIEMKNKFYTYEIVKNNISYLNLWCQIFTFSKYYKKAFSRFFRVKHSFLNDISIINEELYSKGKYKKINKGE